jgi:hypothetical protein
MRVLLTSAVLAGFVLLPAQRGQAADRAAALAVIDRAIDARGGATRLAKARLMIRLARGTQTSGNVEVSFSTDLTVALPDRLRDVILSEGSGPKQRLERVINRNKGWVAGPGKVEEIAKRELEPLLEEVYMIWIETLAPLRDRAFELTLLPDERIDRRPAQVVRVSHKDHADAKLFFDRETHLLVKVQFRGQQGALGVLKEYVFSDYKEFDGLRMPRRQVEYVNGDRTGELRTSTYRFPDKVDDSLFAKP